MGRTADPPAVQLAKGSPGRRRSAMRKREAEIARVAELLAAAPVDPADPNAPPALIDRGPMFAAAVAVWKQLAPKLSSTHRLQPQHRPLFAMFCVYFAEWVLANEDIMLHGPTQVVQTTVGGSMERVRPIVRMRDAAFDQVLKLSDRFGLTPSDEYALFKEQQIAAALNPGLFDREPRQSAAEAKPDESPAPTGGIIGVMKRLDSVPPGARPN